MNQDLAKQVANLNESKETFVHQISVEQAKDTIRGGNQYSTLHEDDPQVL